MEIETTARQTRETSFGWMIQRLASAINTRIETALAPHDLSLSQFAVMMIVLEHARLTQAEISAHFSMPAYAISRAIDHLEGAGLLRHSPHPTSRRAHLIEATEAGRALAPTLFAIVREVKAALVADLPNEDREALAHILPRLMDTLRPGNADQRGAPRPALKWTRLIPRLAGARRSGPKGKSRPAGARAA